MVRRGVSTAALGVCAGIAAFAFACNAPLVEPVDGSGASGAGGSSGSLMSTTQTSTAEGSGGGSSVGTTSSGEGGGTPTPCTPEIGSIQQVIFAPSCGVSGCHAASKPAANLDLVSPNVAQRLLDVPAKGCTALLVSGGRPDSSFLYRKVHDATPACGDVMPPIGPTLPEDQLACIHDWIAGLPAGCETCGTGSCIDTDTDEAHCGACGQACNPVMHCTGGICVCNNGGAFCGNACTDTNTDVKNCGTCGRVCGFNEVCTLGECTDKGCGSLTKCGNSCVNLMFDTQNCGGCGVTCPSSEFCSNGTCMCSGAGDFQTDPNNCGVCGNKCRLGESCVGGQCLCGTASVPFALAVQPIFSAHCSSANCHTGPDAKAQLNLSAGQSYAELVNVAAAQCNNTRDLVEPGQPWNSYLIHKIKNVNLCGGGRMPTGYELQATQYQTIVDWICEGAPNN